MLLLVDDDEAKRYVMATWLRRAGHTVIEAATGREALAQVGTAELVLLDVHLPDISGFEVCRQIKGDPRTAAIPVIQVSATAVAVSDKAQGLTQGADAYLVDPTEPEELLAVGHGSAALLPGPPAGRADRLPADVADQRHPEHQHGADLWRPRARRRGRGRADLRGPRPC